MQLGYSNQTCWLKDYIPNLPRLGVKKGAEYIAKDCANLKNMRLWV